MSRVLLIKNANLYDPDPKGIRDILIVDEKVFSVAEHIDPPELSAPVEVVSADGKMVIPGYVDQHVHVIGGGGAKLLVTRLSSLHEEVRDAVKAGVPVEKAIRICGENPARANGLFPKKGCIRPGMVKCTHGTGTFLDMTIGSTPVIDTASASTPASVNDLRALAGERRSLL